MRCDEQRELCKEEDYTPGWNFEGSSFTVKTEKYNLDGVSDTLHHIFSRFEKELRCGVFAGCSQSDLRIRGFLLSNSVLVNICIPPHKCTCSVKRQWGFVSLKEFHIILHVILIKKLAFVNKALSYQFFQQSLKHLSDIFNVSTGAGLEATEDWMLVSSPWQNHYRAGWSYKVQDLKHICFYFSKESCIILALPLTAREERRKFM